MENKTIGVLTPLLDGFYFNGILQGIQQITEEKKMNLSIFQTMNAAMSKVTYQQFLASDYIDGWIVLLNAVTDPKYITKLESFGKPVICTPYQGEFSNCSVYTIDNELGGYQATTHLIQHGHRRIACVYSSTNPECEIRYKGYLRALNDYNIPFNPYDVYDMEDLLENNGWEAAEQMKARGMGFTAVAAFADMVAVGIMDRFRQWGFSIPEDLAIIGFDNLDIARQSGLTSIEQPLHSRGYQMGLILSHQMQTASTDASTLPTYMEPTNLVIRHSCGCAPENPEEDLGELYKAGIETVDYLSRIIQRNHRIGQELVRADAAKIKDLSWLSSTEYSWGCLALWSGDQLRIESIYSKKAYSPIQSGLCYDEQDFPPLSLYSILDAQEVISVHTIKADNRDFGFMLLIGKINDKNRTSNYQYDTMTHSLDLLAYALEREAMYEEARERENRLAIVSSTTSDGIFDWNLTSNMISWNQEINRILNQNSLIMHADEFYSLIHPDDLHGTQLALELHWQQGVPYQVEYRMRKNDHEYIWIASAGEAVRNQDGEPLRMIGSVRDITERKQAEEVIRHQAYHDSLTNLPNRRYIYDQISEQANMADSIFAVMMLDLDRFKVINDSLGHSAGDHLLQEISQLIRDKIRPNDLVARLGGDEFIIVCPRLDSHQEAMNVAENVLTAMNTQFEINGSHSFVTSSIGISFFPEHGTDRETLVRNADIAMYQAKESGKNCIQLYDEYMSQGSLHKLKMENHLRKALDGNEFELYYQPQMDISTNRIIGVEALLRWFSPELGPVSPKDFIPLAEETGAIVPLSEWVLRRACTDNKRLLDQGMPPLIVSVNISANHFMNVSFVDTVQQILTETNLPAKLLCLEITENVAIQNLTLTIHHLNNLSALGVKIALDDFGTGNSSLSLVKTLPLHMIKIDQAFVQDMTQSDVNRVIFSAILNLTHGLKLESCAEGVETQEQYQLIQELHCETVQGYFISRPLPYDELRIFMNKQ